MKHFAKLFTTERTQVLVFLGSDKRNAPMVYRRLCLDGIYVGLDLTWPADSEECWRLAEAEFNSFDQAKAEAMASDAAAILKKGNP